MAYADPNTHGYSHATSSSRITGIVFVVILHIIAIYGLALGLAHKTVELRRGPIQVSHIDEIKPDKPPPPPPPPKPVEIEKVYVPPAAFEITQSAPVTNAITQTTAVKPVEAPPAPPAPVVQHVAVTVLPKPSAANGTIMLDHYPPMSKRLSEEGTVTLRLLVDTDGRVIDTQLVKSSGFDRLDKAALENAKQYLRYAAGTIDGKPSQQWIIQPVKYTLQ